MNLLKNLLEQIYFQIFKIDKVKFKVVVVVDGSTDGTLEMLKNDFQEVHIVLGDGNWWYTKSINEGFKYSIEKLNSDYILTLNDDVILSDNYMERLGKIINGININTIIGSLAYTNETKPRIVSSGNVWKNRCLGIYKQYIPFLSYIEPSKLTGFHSSVTLPGRGILVHKKILQELNYFDKHYKQYHSDGDFTLRALAKGFAVKTSWDLQLKVMLLETSSSTSFINNSYISAIKSFFDPVSRNYLPSKSRFIWRHGKRACYILRLIIFVGMVFYKITKNKFE